MIEERTLLTFPLTICYIDGCFYMFQADYAEKGIYCAVKGSVLSCNVGEKLKVERLRYIFPVGKCRPPSLEEIRIYNKEKTV